MSAFRLAVDKALSNIGHFAPVEAEAILEIAYLTMAVDEELREEEIDAFSVIAAAMLGQGRAALDDASLRRWLDRFAGELDRNTILERMNAAVASLGSEKAPRLAAYRVACLMAMSDMDAADREFEFDLDLIATLGLTQDEADREADEVNAALCPPEN